MSHLRTAIVATGFSTALLLAACGATQLATPTPPPRVTVETVTITPPTPSSMDVGTRIPEAWDTTTFTIQPTSTPIPPEDLDRPTAEDTPPVVGAAHAVVESITDGDTIRVQLDGESRPVRILGINTPETVDPRKPVECGGPEATAGITSIIGGNVVILTPDPTQGDTDRYGRLLRYIDLPDGTDVGEQLIRQGLARQAEYDGHYTRQQAYIDAEQGAKTERAGSWATCGW